MKMKKLFKELVKVIIGRSKTINVSKTLRKTNYNCPVCRKQNVYFNQLPSNYFKKLDQHGFIHSIFQAETLNIGQYSCSNCGASDRERLYALYFEQVFVHKKPTLNLLDIAPAIPFTKYLKSIPELSIRTMDLFMPDVDDVADITSMNIYKDGQFDIFICSHVLEHIEDDFAAIKELYRILAVNGWGIVMVPINLGLKENYEDRTVNDEAGRWKYFGQDDHVRLYSKKGFTERLSAEGFTVHEFGIDFFGKNNFARHGIHKRSVLYIVTK